MRKSVYIIFGFIIWIGAAIFLSSATGDDSDDAATPASKVRYDSVFVSISPDLTDEDGNILIDVDGPGDKSRTVSVRQAYWLDILPR